MATGDTNDIAQRIKRGLPASWFASDVTPVLDSVIAGFAAPLTWIYSFYSYVLLQMRITTSTGVWIDRSSYDFLGDRLPRRSAVNSTTGIITAIEPDDAYRTRVLAEILRPRQTRSAIVLALTQLTGKTPDVREPWNPGDCGAYGGPAIGYGVAGCYGSLQYPAQVFVTAYRSTGAGVPNVGGYGVGMIGYGVAGSYIDRSQIVGPITDDEIYSTVAHTVAAGVIAWTAIQDNPATKPSPHPTFDSTAYSADSSSLTMDKQ